VNTTNADVAGILDALDIPIIIVGRDCKIFRFNQAAESVFGLKGSDLGRLPSNVRRLNELQDIENLSGKVMADEVPCRHEIQYGDRWFILRITPYKGNSQGAEGAILAFTNVTAFRESITQAIYEREYTKTILNTVAQPLVVLDADLRVQTANRAFYTMFEFSREATKDTPLPGFGNHEWSVLSLWASLKNVFENGEFKIVEVEADFPTIGRRTVLIDAHRLPHDGKATILVALRDITELKLAEKRYETLFNSMDEGFCTIEMIFDENQEPLDYRFLDINPAFAKQTGLKDAKGKLMRDLAPAHEQHWFDIYGKIALTGESARFENRAAALNRWYEVNAFRVGPPEARRVGIVFNDITERKHAEEALIVARDSAEKANKAKDHFLAALSHELRTPLTPVLALLSGFDGNPAIPKNIDENLETIRRNVELEVRLIDDLLDLTRITRGKLDLHYHRTHIGEIVEDAVNTCLSDLQTKRLLLVREIKNPELEIVADRTRITQILWNLLKNSIKFTPEGGIITIRSQRVSENEIMIQVQDTGIGIEPAQLEPVFDAFEQGDHKITRQFGGLGLGLAISRAIAEAHRGTLTAKSEGHGRGSTFTLTLPLQTREESRKFVFPAANDVSSELANQDISKQSLRILLVEDHADTANSLSMLLRRRGYVVTLAANVSEALKLAAAETFDLLISDLGLPDASGYELMKEVRQIQEIPGIALSGFGMEEDIKKCYDAGFIEHLVKPIRITQLEEVISRVFASS
jgi:PAS domain S-box-containing protein